MAVKYRIGIVSQSPIADDPRVRRQGEAFEDAGWEVVGIGLEGARSAAPRWPILTQADSEKLPESPSMPATGYMTTGLRSLALQIFDWIAAQKVFHLSRPDRNLLSVRIDRRRAETIYWTMNSVFWDFFALGKMQSVDLWIGNDWTSLPIVARLASMQGVPFTYDTHELAVDEFNEDLRWRFVERPIRLAIEGSFIKNAAIVSAVSESIALELAEIHRLGVAPITVRSTPNYEKIPFRAVGDQVRVLYHGVVREHRGLEACIRSVSKWRPEFNLTIRGPTSGAYRDVLEREIDMARVRERVQLAPPVPMTELVREASTYDIGLFALPGHSEHNRFALPNKLFEYIMAGLALCVSNLKEMARLVHEFDVGTLIHSTDADAIAIAMNSFDRDKINYYKQKSLTAAKTLCWEHEKVVMLQAYTQVIDQRRHIHVA